MPLQEVHTGFTFNFDGSKLAAIQKGVKRAATSTNSIAAGTEVLQQKMGGLLDRAKGIIAAYLGFRAVRAVTTDFAANADAAAKTAEGLGLTVEQYTALKFVAEDGGIAMTELGNAMGKLSRRAAEASRGSKENVKVFKDMEIDVHGANGELKSSMELLLNVSDRFKGMKQGSAKTALALKLFEETGAKFVSTMNLGAGGIKKLMAEAKRLGVVIDKDGAKKAAAYKAAMLRLNAVFKGIRNRIALQVIPAITNAADRFNKWAKESNNLENALKRARTAAKFAFLAISAVVAAKTVKLWQKGVKTLLEITSALKKMGWAGAFAQIKMLALVAAIVILGLIIEDLVGFAQGKDSIIGRILGDTQKAKDLRDVMIGIGVAIKKAWKDLAPVLAKAWTDLRPEVEKLWKVIQPLIGPTFRAWIKFITFAFQLWGLAIGFVSASLQIVIGTFTAVASIGKATAEEITIAWEDASDFIAEAWEDLGEVISLTAKSMGIDLGLAAAGAKKAWDVTMGGITAAVGVLSKGMSKALAIKNALFGVSIETDIFDAQEAIRKAVVARQTELATPGGFAPTGLFGIGAAAPAGPTGPIGIGATARSGFESNVVNTAVAAGAVQLTVNAGGSPQEVAAAVNVMVQKNLKKTITDASRDIKKPPSGQR
jgi:hypothetical protein